MMATTNRSQVQVRRLLDRSQRRKPLRLWISRRAARNGSGNEGMGASRITGDIMNMVAQGAGRGGYASLTVIPTGSALAFERPA